jgi:hypothetical protein
MQCVFKYIYLKGILCRLNFKTGKSHFFPTCEADFLKSGGKVLTVTILCVQIKN